MNAVDTNVLIYAHDPRDPKKQQAAISLIQSLTDGVLIWQVACEYLAASRKLEPLGFSVNSAWQDIAQLQKVWHTRLPTWDVLATAEGMIAELQLSFWDALIAAACLESGVERLYTEDFGATPTIRGLEVVNPFGD